MIDRRLFLGAAVALGASRAAAQAPPGMTAAPDVPHSQIEKSVLAMANADIIRRQNDLLNGGKVAEATQLFAEDTRNHGFPVGRKGVLRVLTDIHATFPDVHADIYDLMAIGDEVVIRVINSGTHLGIARIPVMGGLLVGVPPTGKRFKVQAIHWFTLKDGMIAEHRASRDDIGMMQQLGLLPTSPRYDLPKVH
jgi:predicted ester cyclase